MRALAAALAASILFPAQLAAQQSPSPSKDTVAARAGEPEKANSKSARATPLEPVKVTARVRASGAGYSAPVNASALKTPALLRDVPQALSVVTRQLIRDQSMQSMADVVRYMPGVTSGQGEGNRDQIVIRGNSSTADFFVDGVRDDVQFYRDLYNVESVEVLKGSNAMIFGRGGGGGVLNRVVKEAGWTAKRELTLEGGPYDQRRASGDIGFALSTSFATRLMGVYESSGSFRDGVSLERYGVNPALTIASRNASTKLALGYEHFRDQRTADRGIPSFQGRPFKTKRSTFFGDPRQSYADARVNAASSTLTHTTAGGLGIRNQARIALYDKFYQNVFPGAIDASGSEVSVEAYNSATQRRNVFDQTEVSVPFTTGRAAHLLLLGAEGGRQSTDNFRNTGYFNGSTSSVAAPISNPTIATPITFRQSASDAHNHVAATVVSLYAQNQITLSPLWRIVAGARFETFKIDHRNNRTGVTLARRDAMLSPRFGLIYKPREAVSVYGSYSVSHLPSSGDQFSSLSDVTRALKPEAFVNYELGAKWDIADRLTLSTAAYHLDRSNTRANDPRNPARTVQTGSQRTNGYELELRGMINPAWDIVAGFARQNALIRSATTAAPAGARVPLVPKNTASLWNKYQLSRRWAVGAGLTYQTSSYAAIDNTVTLPAFGEVDGAVYYEMGSRTRLQLNLENLVNARYFATANGNNNISPGEPRSMRLSVSTAF